MCVQSVASLCRQCVYMCVCQNVPLACHEFSERNPANRYTVCGSQLNLQVIHIVSGQESSVGHA
jgi:hypothetical protein